MAAQEQNKSYKEKSLETFNIKNDADINEWIKQHDLINIAVFTENINDELTRIGGKIYV